MPHSGDTAADPPPGDTGDTGGLQDTGPMTGVVLASGPVVTCADPAQRDSEGRWRRVSVSAPIASPSNLTGSAVVVADLTGDPVPEVVFGGPGEIAIQQKGPHGWSDISDRLLLLDVPFGDIWCGSAADYDGDGDLDLFLGGPGRNLLLRNEAGVLRDVTLAAGLGDTTWNSVSSSWSDFDLDGDLDLMVGNYAPGVEAGEPDIRPTHPSELYRNDGDGTFSDASELLPPRVQNAFVFMTGWYDIDRDTWPDLITLHDFGWARPNGHVLHNVEGRALVGDEFVSHVDGMGLAVMDLDDDGGLDILISSAYDVLFKFGVPDDSSLGWSWPVESGPAYGLDAMLLDRYQHFGWGIAAQDVDNDGDIDVPVLWGYWDEYADPYPFEQDALWIQGEDGMFVDRAGEWGVADGGDGRGLIVADLDDDGWLEMVKREIGLRQPSIYEARCGVEHWTKIRLRQPDTMNVFGIGARVEVRAGDDLQTRWLESGSSSMFSGGPPEVHVGLGELSRFELTVVWPDGFTTVHSDLEVDRVITLTR